MKIVLLVLFCTSLFAAPKIRTEFDWKKIAQVPIQDRGRVKPLETFAMETVRYVTHRTSWKGRPAVEVLFGWITSFEKEWKEEPILKIDHQPLKRALGLNPDLAYFTLDEIEQNAELTKLVQAAMEKEQAKEKQDELGKKVLQIQNQRGLLESIITGRSLTLLPNPQGLHQPWFSLTILSDDPGSLPYAREKTMALSENVKNILTHFIDGNAVQWNDETGKLQNQLREVANGAYPSTTHLKIESHYNSLHPFRMAWILYTLAFFTLLAFQLSKIKGTKAVGIASLVAGFLMHTYGFGLRCYIAERPPVTNMYESVIWVTWGCVLFSLMIGYAYKNLLIPSAALVFSIVGLVLADNIPIVLDPSINPLEPVLRSNFWLTIHVLTITLSYAAFAVSLCLGNVVIGNYLFRPHAVDSIQTSSLFMYRAMQIGVILLAAGTILGGVWADYSWGRFWGWDPKEVWALIALLLYLAVLHGRFTGWLKGFGFATVTILSFLGVLMAWYGVNFVLGVGLHSYGFGTGGMPWVVTYVLIQCLFIVVAYIRGGHGKANSAALFPKK